MSPVGRRALRDRVGDRALAEPMRQDCIFGTSVPAMRWYRRAASGVALAAPWSIARDRLAGAVRSVCVQPPALAAASDGQNPDERYDRDHETERVADVCLLQSPLRPPTRTPARVGAISCRRGHECEAVGRPRRELSALAARTGLDDVSKSPGDVRDRTATCYRSGATRHHHACGSKSPAASRTRRRSANS